jgi:putative transposase
MARPLRIAYPGALYHLTSRGNEKRPIYFNDADRHHFLRILAKTVQRFSWLCSAYCLMDNHFHLLVETSLANISQSMKFLNGVYTQYINWKYKRVGHLFQGRFKAILVEKESYFMELCRYIVLNPVRAGICLEPDQYPWSSFRSTAGLSSKPEFLTLAPILDRFGSEIETSSECYKRFVKEGVNIRPWNNLKGQIYLGSDAFIQSLPALPFPPNGIPKKQLPIERPPLQELIHQADGMYVARVKYQYSVKDISSALGIHRNTITRRMRAWLGSDPIMHHYGA